MRNEVMKIYFADIQCGEMTMRTTQSKHPIVSSNFLKNTKKGLKAQISVLLRFYGTNPGNGVNLTGNV